MESKTLAKVEDGAKQKAVRPLAGMIPRTIEEGMQLATIFAKSGIVPKEMVGKPESVFLAISLGMEIGLPPTQAVTSIMVVNGRPSIWGDALKAVVIGKTVPVYTEEGVFIGEKNICEEFDEDSPDVALKQGYGRCRVKRRGKPAKEVRFSIEDAKRAGLWNKVGPWQQYPGRMLMSRARSWVCRDEFPDLLKGLQLREEVEDFESKYTPTPMPTAAPEKIIETTAVVDAPSAAEPMPVSAPVDAGDGQAPGDSPADPINEDDRKLIFRLIKDNGVSMDAFKNYLFSKHNITSTADIPLGLMAEIETWIKSPKK